MSKPKKSKKHEIIEYPATQEEARRVGSPFFRTAELCPAQHFEEEKEVFQDSDLHRPANVSLADMGRMAAPKRITAKRPNISAIAGP